MFLEHFRALLSTTSTHYFPSTASFPTTPTFSRSWTTVPRFIIDIDHPCLLSCRCSIFPMCVHSEQTQWTKRNATQYSSKSWKRKYYRKNWGWNLKMYLCEFTVIVFPFHPEFYRTFSKVPDLYSVLGCTSIYYFLFALFSVELLPRISFSSLWKLGQYMLMESICI